MISSAIVPGYLRGIAELEPTDRGVRLHRLPGWVRRQFPDGQLLAMESQPSGARLVLRHGSSYGTAATAVDLVSHPTRVAYRGADRPRGRFDVFVNGVLTKRDVLDHGDVISVDLETGAMSHQPGPSHTTALRGLPGGVNRIEIWLPHNETVDLVELRADAPIAEDPTAAPLWLHHGSSISQGSNATAPSETWPAVAARLAGVDLRNLGFGGSALADPFIARVIRDTEADVISEARHQRREPGRHAAPRVRPRSPRVPRYDP